MALLSVAEALARVTKGLTPVDTEQVTLGEACGRVLAEDVVAGLTQPPFDASAMDGYAVRADDVVTVPATLRLIGEALAGSGFAGKLGQGEAVRIFTGAPVPAGADTIVIQENTEASAGVITVKEAGPGRHIRPRGQDFTQGEVLLCAGAKLGPRELMLAAATNHAELPVRRKPKVAILAAVETVTSKMPATLDAAALCKMAERGQIRNAILEGPLAFDNAISRDAARTKGIESEVAGDPDILLAPDLEAGNILAKLLNFLAKADSAGLVLGARVPIILTSRADSVRARIASCAVAMLAAHARRPTAAVAS